MKKTLIILGTHPNGLKTFDWSRTDCDIWMFNEAPNIRINGKLIYPKADAVFQLHHEAIWKNPKNRSDEEHYDWLKSGNTPEIYMQEKFTDVPKSRKYPLEEILKLTKNIRLVVNGKEREFKYFGSTPDYALALVASMWKHHKRYKRVEIHGIELETESEYQYQRTGFGFWTGYLTALGIELVVYNSIYNAPMYGYEGDAAIPSTQFEQRISELTEELGDSKERYTQEANSLLASLSEFLNQDVSKAIEKGINDLALHYERTGTLNGKIKENQRYLEKAKAMEETTGTSVFSVGEFDGARQQYQKQYDSVRKEANELNYRIGLLLRKLLNLKKGSSKRKNAIDEIGTLMADLINKNMLLLNIAGGIEENKYYIDSAKLSIRTRGGS